MLSSLVTTWVAQVRWGDRRLHTEALDREGTKKLTLGPELGTDARATLEWTALGLRVTLSPGFTGRASLRGDRPVALSALASRGRAKEQADALEILLEPGDTLTLNAQALEIRIGAASVPVKRLSIDVKSLGLLALAIFAVVLVFASIQ
jgi:hypothetical protein